MGQIVSSAAKPKRCNANQLSQLPTPAAGEHILVSSDNSMNAAGQGNFDCYIEGDGQNTASYLAEHSLMDIDSVNIGEPAEQTADLEISDKDGYILARFINGGIITKNFNSENVHNLKIMFFGNSLTQDAVECLPLLLKEIAPEIKFTIYVWYNAGASLKKQYDDYLIGGANCDIFSIYTSDSATWSNLANSKNISWVVENCDFDVLCLQEYSYFTWTDAELKTNFDNVANWFFNNYDKSIKVVNLIDAPNRSMVETMFSRAKSYTEYFLKSTCDESVIPAGVAIYYALQTSLSSLGDNGGLTPDGTHAQEGLPCLLQAYVVAMWIFQHLGIAKSIFGSTTRITNSVYTQLNPPGPNLGSGVVTGTDAQHLIAQECAIKASKIGKTLEFESLINNA